MKHIRIPTKLKNNFQYKNRKLIFLLNQNLESNELLTDYESHAYLALCE
jgi:hypothetical protein